MIDKALQLTVNVPAAGGNVQANLIDIGVDAAVFSNQWREGRLNIAWPAMPNFTSNSDTITVNIQDSADGVTFANTSPLIQVQIPGVATNGVAASSVDCPLPPGLRGPIGIFVAATAGAGNNTAATITASWKNE